MIIHKQLDTVVSNVAAAKFKLHENITEQFIIEGIIKMYVDKEGSIVRELCSNCADTGAKFYFGMKGNMIFFRDLGEGISPDFMNNQYLNVGYSTKSDSNEFIGGWGYGRISILSYTNRYFIDTCYKDKFYKYMVEIDTVPKLYLLEESDRTIQETGTSVYFEIDKDSRDDWDDAINTHGQFFENGIMCFDDKYNPYEERCKKVTINGVDVILSKGTEDGVVYGQCFYPFKYISNLGMDSHFTNTYIHLPLSEDIKPMRSREGFDNEDFVRKIVNEKIDKLNNAPSILREGFEAADTFLNFVTEKRVVHENPCIISRVKDNSNSPYNVNYRTLFLWSNRNTISTYSIWNISRDNYIIEDVGRLPKYLINFSKYVVLKKRVLLNPEEEEVANTLVSQLPKLSELIKKLQGDKPVVKKERVKREVNKDSFDVYRKSLISGVEYVKDKEPYALQRHTMYFSGVINSLRFNLALLFPKRHDTRVVWVKDTSKAKHLKTINMDVLDSLNNLNNNQVIEDFKKTIDADVLKHLKKVYLSAKCYEISKRLIRYGDARHYGLKPMIEQLSLRYNLNSELIENTIWEGANIYDSLKKFILDTGNALLFDEEFENEIKIIELLSKYYDSDVVRNFKSSFFEEYNEFVTFAIRKKMINFKSTK